MAGWRNTFVKALGGVGKRIPFSWLRRWAGQPIIVPLYHVVSDAPLPHIQHLYPIKSTKAFRTDLVFLLRHFEPIDLLALRDHTTGERRLKKPSFLLTFDDGLREFHDVIAPILQEKGVPAVCFLNTAFLDNQGLFFRYKASYLLAEMAGGQHAEKLRQWWELEEKEGYQGARNLLHLGYDQSKMLDRLAEMLEIRFSDFLQSQRPYLTHEQVEALIRRGFQFGGHSVDHPEYQYLDIASQLRQTRESMEAVQRKFALPYRSFAFPFTDFGVSKAFFEQLQREAGAPDLTFGCAGLKQEEVPRHWQRIPLEMQTLSANSIIPTEFLYYLLKMPFGKHKMKR